MRAAIAGLRDDEVPAGLDGEPARLSARGIVLAAQVCVEHLIGQRGARPSATASRFADLVGLHVLAPPGTGVDRTYPSRADLKHTRGLTRVAVLAGLAAAEERAGRADAASALTEQAVQLTTAALRGTPDALHAYLLALRRQLVAEEQPKAPVAPPPAVPELLARVYTDPLSDELRQVVADHLAELGDPRGDFIALQYAKAAGRGTPELEAATAKLLGEHRLAWLGPLAVVTRTATFARGFLDDIVVANVPRAVLASVAGAPEWATVRSITFEGKLACPRGLKPEPVAAQVLGHDATRSLRSLRGVNSILLEALSRHSVTRRLESIAVSLDASSRSTFVQTLRCFTNLKNLALDLGRDASLLAELEVERLELLELASVPLHAALEMSAHTPCLHVRGDLGQATRLPGVVFWKSPEGRRAWVNLGMPNTPRATLMGFLEQTSWRDWASVVVYAKQTFGDEPHRLQALTQRWMQLAVTSVPTGAPRVEPMLTENRPFWLRPRRAAALLAAPV